MYNFESHRDNRQIVTGSVVEATHQFEAYKNLEVLKNGKEKKTFLTTANYSREINFDALLGASESYHISPNPEDYIIIPLPIVTVDVPNRNKEAFSLEEVSYFDPRYGCFVYNTFNNKPCHKDHKNQDPTKALGMHLDSSLIYNPKYDIWKISVLTIWDRTKDAQRVNDIINGKINGYSMGSFVDNFQCNICGANDVNIKPCEHKFGRVYGANNRLAHKNLWGVCYFETSSVGEPADDTAFSSDVFI